MSKSPGKMQVSFTVSFSTSTDKTGVLLVEIDDREDGFNKGKTSGFFPGEAVGLLLFKGLGVDHKQTHTSMGSVSFGGSTQVEKEDTVVLSAPDNLTGTLKYPVSEIISERWLGNELGACSISKGDGSILVTTGKRFGIGVYYVKYLAEAKTGVLSTPALSLPKYDVAVQVVGTFDPLLVA